MSSSENYTAVANRLTELTKMSGFNFDDNSVIKGEIDGYCSGIALVLTTLDEVFNEMFPSTASSFGLKKFLQMLSINAPSSDEEALEPIQNRFEFVFGSFDLDSFNNDLQTFGENASYSSNDCTVTFSGVELSTFEIAKAFGYFLKEYIPPFMYIVFDGDGYTFDEWEACDFCFDNFDKICLPFSSLDTINSNI